MRAPATLAIAAAAIASLTGAAAAGPPGADAATDGAVFAGVTGADFANLTTNPSALLRIEPGVHAFTIGRFALDQIAIERRLVDPDTGALSAGPDVSEANFGAGATAGVGYVGPRTAFAFSATLRPPDETITDPAVSDHTRGTRGRRIDLLAFGFAFRPVSRLTVGVGAALIQRFQRLAFSRDTALEAGRDPARGLGSPCGDHPCGLEDPAARELWNVDVSWGPIDEITGNIVLTGGAMARLPWRGIVVGASIERPYFSSEVTMTGTASIVRAPRDGGQTLVGRAEVRQQRPEIWRLGGRGPLAPGWELVGEARWRRTERMDRVDLRLYGGDFTGTDVPEWTLRPLGLRDAIAGDVGVEQIDTGQRLRWGTRLGFDSGAVADHRLSARAPWGKQLSAATGVQLRSDRWVLQLGYRLDWQLPASSDTSAFDPLARIECVEADYDYDLPACATVRAGYGTSSAAGRYGRWSHGARIALRFVIR